MVKLWRKKKQQPVKTIQIDRVDAKPPEPPAPYSSNHQTNNMVAPPIGRKPRADPIPDIKIQETTPDAKSGQSPMFSDFLNDMNLSGGDSLLRGMNLTDTTAAGSPHGSSSVSDGFVSAHTDEEDNDSRASPVMGARRRLNKNKPKRSHSKVKNRGNNLNSHKAQGKLQERSKSPTNGGPKPPNPAIQKRPLPKSNEGSNASLNNINNNNNVSPSNSTKDNSDTNLNTQPMDDSLPPSPQLQTQLTQQQLQQYTMDQQTLNNKFRTNTDPRYYQQARLMQMQQNYLLKKRENRFGNWKPRERKEEPAPEPTNLRKDRKSRKSKKSKKENRDVFPTVPDLKFGKNKDEESKGKVFYDEKEQMFRVEINVARFHSDDISISFKEGKLTVSGETVTGDDYGTVTCKFEKSFKLPDGVSLTDIKSKINVLGVLRITCGEEKNKQ